MKALLALFLIFVVACTAPLGDENSTDTQDEQVVMEPSNPKLTDLSPGVYSDSLYLSPGEEIELWMVVKNSGFTEVMKDSSYVLTLSKDESELESDSGKFTANLLASQEEKATSFTYTFNEVGEYTLKGTVDSANEIEEKNEENNAVSLTIYVREESNDEEDTQEESSDDSDDSSEESDDESSFDGSCSDSDDGKEYAKVGTCTDVSFPNGRTDFCRSDEDLAELFCQADRCNFDIHTCDGICKEGKCI